MQNQIFHLEDKNRKVFGFNETQVIFSSKGHDTFESLLASTEKKGLLESIKTINIADIQKIEFNEKSESFIIHYDKAGKTKKEGFTLDNQEYRSELVESIANLKTLNKEVTEESKIQPLLLNLLGIIVIGGLTWVFRGIAIDAQNGIEFEATGRRSGIKNLLASGAEMLGPTGVLLVGLAGVAYVAYLAYNRYNKPASNIIYN